MITIAESLQYNTPEPVLIVVGGSDWNIVAYVFPRHGSPIGMTASSPDLSQRIGACDIGVEPVQP